MGLEQECTDIPIVMFKGQKSGTQPSLELETAPNLSAQFCACTNALPVYLCEVCSISIRSSSQALPAAVLLLSSTISVWDSTWELLRGEGQLQTI